MPCRRVIYQGIKRKLEEAGLEESLTSCSQQPVQKRKLLFLYHADLFVNSYLTVKAKRLLCFREPVRPGEGQQPPGSCEEYK